MKKSYFFLTLMLLVGNIGFSQVDYYVDDNTGNDNNSGTSWNAPFRSLDKVLERIGYETNNGQTYNVHLKEGVYTRYNSTGSYEFDGNKVINFIGGYPQNATSNCFRDPVNNRSELYYTRRNGMFRILSDTDLNFDGIYYNDPSLAGGAADATFLDFKNGSNSHNSIKNSMICGFSSVTPSFIHYRKVTNSSLTIDNCYIANGVPYGSNSGFFYLWGGSNVVINVSNSTFHNNNTGGSNGALFRTNERTGIYNPGVVINVENSTFGNNTKTEKAPVFNIIGTTLNIDESDFVKNNGVNGAVVYVHDKGSTLRDLTSYVTITNSRFKDNKASSGGGVLYVDDNDGLTILSNNIYSGNTTDFIRGASQLTSNDYANSLDISYNTSCSVESVNTCTGNIYGNVSEDTDNDNLGEKPIANVTIVLKNTDGTIVFTTLTDQMGNYAFLDVEAGDYYIEELQPNSYVSVQDTDVTPEDINDGIVNNDNIISVSLEAGEDDLDNNFVEEKLAKLSGNVSEDTNNDDEGEVNISNVLIELYRGSIKIADTRTNGLGNYTFDGLEPGDYIVKQVQPIGFESVRDGDDLPDGDAGENSNTNDNIIAVALVGGEHDTDNDFVEERFGRITGSVLEDSDNDNLGDLPIEEVIITLLDANGDIVKTTKTDAAGNYEFTNLPTGEYTILESQPLNYEDVIDGDISPEDVNDGILNTDNEISVILTPGENDSDNNFIEEKLGTISGTVTEDTNNDDNGEESIEGVVISLKNSNGELVTTTITDDTGFYEFVGLPAGTYFVIESQPINYVDVKDSDASPEDTADGEENTDNVIPVMLESGEDDTDNNFVEEKLGTISGTVKEDTNNDDVGDKPLSGILITLKNENGEVLQTKRTDDLGRYEFTDLPAGEYTIEEEQPADYTDVRDGDESPEDTIDGIFNTDNSIPVTLTSGENDTDNNFVEEIVSTISGNVSDDTDNDGNGDQPIEGVEITLKDVNGNVLATTATDPSGNYEFTDLPAGEYILEETQPTFGNLPYLDVKDGDVTPEDINDGTQNTDNVIPVTLTKGENDADNNFVETLFSKISGYVTEDTNEDNIGEEPIKEVVITLFGRNTFTSLTTVTDENGYYEFSGLAVDEYKVTQFQPNGFVDVKHGDESNDGDPTDGDVSDNNTAVKDFIKVVLERGEHDTQNNFVEESIFGSIAGNVSEDTNNDNVGDDPIVGVEIRMTNLTTGDVFIKFTDQNGNYLFENLDPGKYSVEEVQPFGYEDVKHLDEDTSEVPADSSDGLAFKNTDGNDVLLVTLDPAEDDILNNFVEERLGSISGYVTEIEKDGTPIPDVTIELIDDTGKIIGTTVTDELGFYEFIDLPKGVYIVKETQPKDYFSVNDIDHDETDPLDVVGQDTFDDIENDNKLTVYLASGENDIRNDFIEIIDPNTFPVEFTLIEVELDKSNVIITWATASEFNNSGFVVERSHDGITFEAIGEVAGNGTTSELNEYIFRDDNLSQGTVYYRIKQVDLDGVYSYSDVVSVNINLSLELSVSPTVTREFINIVGLFEATQYEIYNHSGQLVSQGTTSGRVNLNSLSQGVYIIRVIDIDNSVLLTEKIIKQ